MVKNHPQNKKGYVKLFSKDLQDMPEINFMLYEEGKESDMGAMKWTVAWARKIMAAAKGNGVDISPRESPCESVNSHGSCAAQGVDEEWITGQTFGHHHPTSTAKIGKMGMEWRC